jgi:hypothetical protein
MRFCTRRQFLKQLAAGATAAAGGSLLALPGCGRQRTDESEAALMRRMEALHRDLQGLPDNPVAVVQAEKCPMYPFVGDPRDYDRDRNACYALVEEALMALNPGDLENPLSNLVKPGDRVCIKPNWCTQLIFPIPITHPAVVHAVAELAARAGAAEVAIVEGPMTMSYAATWYYGPTFLNVHPWLRHLSRKYPGTRFSHQDGNADDFLWVSLEERSLLRELPLDALAHDRGSVMRDMF